MLLAVIPSKEMQSRFGAPLKFQFPKSGQPAHKLQKFCFGTLESRCHKWPRLKNYFPYVLGKLANPLRAQKKA